MSPQQQKDLETYRLTGVIGDSLKRLFIEDSLKELKNNPAVRTAINKLGLVHISEDEALTSKFHIHPNDDLHFFLSFLSQIPDGQAVMPFLDVETKHYLTIKNNLEQEALKAYSNSPYSGDWEDFFDERFLNTIPKTLQALLLQQFVGVCFNQGKGFDLALAHINQLYIDSVYAN
jgi:hypothetical protein